MQTLTRIVALLALCCSAVPAQDDILAMEKREDQPARDQLVQLLKRTRTDFTTASMTPRDCCRLLTTLCGDKVNFLFMATGDAAATPAFELELKSASLWTVMAAVQRVTGLRFAYRDGVVCMLGKDQLQPLTYLQVYDLRGQVTPLRSFPGPRLGLLGAEEGDKVLYPPAEDSGTTVSGFTAESLEELIRAQVTPELWASDKVSLSNTRGLFVIRQTPAGHQQVRQLLVELGVMSRPRVAVRKPPMAPPCLVRPKR